MGASKLILGRRANVLVRLVLHPRKKVPNMLVKVVMPLETPRHPHGPDVEVIYNPKSKDVVSVQEVGVYRELGRDIRRLVGSVLRLNIQEAGGWKMFSRKRNVCTA